jgi:hypothetical protein
MQRCPLFAAQRRGMGDKTRLCVKVGMSAATEMTMSRVHRCDRDLPLANFSCPSRWGHAIADYCIGDSIGGFARAGGDIRAKCVWSS